MKKTSIIYKEKQNKHVLNDQNIILQKHIKTFLQIPQSR